MRSRRGSVFRLFLDVFWCRGSEFQLHFIISLIKRIFDVFWQAYQFFTLSLDLKRGHAEALFLDVFSAISGVEAPNFDDIF